MHGLLTAIMAMVFLKEKATPAKFLGLGLAILEVGAFVLA